MASVNDESAVNDLGGVEKSTPLMNGLMDVDHHPVDENNADDIPVVDEGANVVNSNNDDPAVEMASAKVGIKEEPKALSPPTDDSRHAEFMDIVRTFTSADSSSTTILLQRVAEYVYGDKVDDAAVAKESNKPWLVKGEPKDGSPVDQELSPSHKKRHMQKAVRRLLIPSVKRLPVGGATTSSTFSNSAQSFTSLAASDTAASSSSPSASPTKVLNAISILHRAAERRKDDGLRARNDQVLDEVMENAVPQRLALVRFPIKMLENKIQMLDTVRLHHQQQQQQKTVIEDQGGSAQKKLAVDQHHPPPPTKSLELDRKYIKMKTANFYKRDNYNMLREESEGFASLFYDLIICRQQSPQHGLAPHQQSIKSILVEHVGYYEIDCFKVLEIALMACLFNISAIDEVIEYSVLLRPEPALLARFACRPMAFIATRGGVTLSAATAGAGNNNTGKSDISAVSSGNAGGSSSSSAHPSPARGSGSSTTKPRDEPTSSRDRASSLAKLSAGESTTAADVAAADDSTTDEERDVLRACLYENAGLLLSRLIDSELLTFEHLMPYINELEEKPLDKIWDEANEEARQYADNLTANSLSSAAGPAAADGGDDVDGLGVDNKDRRKRPSRLQLALSLNIKVQMATAFMQHWHIDAARSLVDLRQASAYHPVARCLSEMLTYSIDLLYRDAVLSGRHATQQPYYTPCGPAYVTKLHAFSSSSTSLKAALPPQLTSISQLDALSPLLSELNANLHCDCIAMHRLLIVIEHCFRKITPSPPLSSSDAASRNNSPVKSRETIGMDNDSQVVATFNELVAWLFEICLLPAMSLTHCNVSLANALWHSGMQYLPYEVRFLLYHRWSEFGYASHPELMRVRGEVRADLKYAVKRLSKDKKSMEKFGRLLAKLATCHPVLAHPYVLSRIESFGELTPIIIESFKYQFSMSLDALQFCVIAYLADPVRTGVKHDKLSIRPWYLYLCEFLAQATRKVPVEMCGVLHYVVAQLKDGKTVDLLVLNKLIEKVSGIEATDDLTDEQLQALTGGTILQQEVFCATSFRVSRKVTNRFREALITQDLALPLALLMIMQKNREIYAVADDKHLKLVGTMYDMCHDTLTQFCTYLSHVFTPQDYATTMPTISELCIQFKVPPDIALYLLRPLFFQAVRDEIAQIEAPSAAVSVPPKPAISAAGVEDLASIVFTTKPLHATVVPNSTPAGGNTGNDAAVALAVEKASQFFERWQSKLQPAATALRPLIRHLVTDVSPQFFVLFWTLSPHDLYVPTHAYDTVLGKLDENLKSDANKSSHELSSKRRKEREKVRDTIEQLRLEKRRQTEHVERVMHCLRRWAEAHLFTESSRTRKNDFILQFIQVCLFPRCMFAPEEARFCAQFIQTIHELRTPYFSTVICYDRVLCDIRGMLMSCSEKEASRFGRMLRAALDTVMRWWSSAPIFEAECRGHPGFVTKVRSSSTAASLQQKQDGAAGEDEDEVTFENYRHLVYKWHFKITKTMVDCIDSHDYMQIRNALTILTHLPPHFPKLLNFYASLEKKVDALRTSEDKKHNNRPDLFALATSYSSRLKQQKTLCIPEDKFHLKTLSTAAADKKQQQQLRAATAHKAATKDASLVAQQKTAAEQPKPAAAVKTVASGKLAASSSNTNNAVPQRLQQQPKSDGIVVAPSNSGGVSKTTSSAIDSSAATQSSNNNKPAGGDGSSKRRDVTPQQTPSSSPSNARGSKLPSRPAHAPLASTTSSSPDDRRKTVNSSRNNGDADRRETSADVAAATKQQHQQSSRNSAGGSTRDRGARSDTHKDEKVRESSATRRSTSRAADGDGKRSTVAAAAKPALSASNSAAAAPSSTSKSSSGASSSGAGTTPRPAQPSKSSSDDDKRRTNNNNGSSSSDAQTRLSTKRSLDSNSVNNSAGIANAVPKTSNNSATAPNSPAKKLKTASSSADDTKQQQQRKPPSTSSNNDELEFSSDDEQQQTKSTTAGGNNNKAGSSAAQSHSVASNSKPVMFGPRPPPSPSARSSIAPNTSSSKPRLPSTSSVSSASAPVKPALPVQQQQKPPLPPPPAPPARAVAPPPPSDQQLHQRRTSTDSGRMPAALTNNNNKSGDARNSSAAAVMQQRSTNDTQRSGGVARPLPPPPPSSSSLVKPKSSGNNMAHQHHEDIDDDEDDLDDGAVFDQA